MPDDISLEIEEGRSVKGIGSLGPLTTHELVKTVEEIADRIEDAARSFAPQGKSGELKLHPVDRSESRLGQVERNFSIGGGFSARGARGRFVKGALPEEAIGNAVVIIGLTLPVVPKEAIFVHEGTGLFGKYHTPIVPTKSSHLVFTLEGRRRFVVKSVKGQVANPYLTKAYELIDRVWVSVEVEKLKAKIEGLSKL